MITPLPLHWHPGVTAFCLA